MTKNKAKWAAYMRRYYAAHPGANSAKVKRWRKANPDKRRKLDQMYQAKLKAAVMNAYGGPKCACCAEEHIEFLSIDHINGGGNEARRKEGHRGGNQFYRQLRKQGFPPGYRVLCMNCNFALGHAGYCPHQHENPVSTHLLIGVGPTIRGKTWQFPI